MLKSAVLQNLGNALKETHATAEITREEMNPEDLSDALVPD